MANEKRAQCKAKSKRSGERCKNPVVPGYTVCRMHGANPNNPGKPAPKGNKRALITGGRESITYDTLTDEERTLWDDIEVDALKQLVGELKLLEIRERRMMQRIAKLAGMDFVQVEKLHRVGFEPRGTVDWTEHRSEASTQLILRIEIALTRVQATKQKVIAKLMDAATEGGDSSFEALLTIFEQIRDARRERRGDDADQDRE